MAAFNFSLLYPLHQLTLFAEYDIFLELVKVEMSRRYEQIVEVREKFGGSREYFQGPGLIGCITGMVWVLQYVALYYKYQEPCQLIFVFIFTSGIVYPLYVLTSIEKFLCQPPYGISFLFSHAPNRIQFTYASVRYNCT